VPQTLIHRSVGDPARFRERAWCAALEGALRARAPGLELTVATPETWTIAAR
jgi:hypothetical protein